MPRKGYFSSKEPLKLIQFFATISFSLMLSVTRNLRRLSVLPEESEYETDSTTNSPNEKFPTWDRKTTSSSSKRRKKKKLSKLSCFQPPDSTRRPLLVLRPPNNINIEAAAAAEDTDKTDTEELEMSVYESPLSSSLCEECSFYATPMEGVSPWTSPQGSFSGRSSNSANTTFLSPPQSATTLGHNLSLTLNRKRSQSLKVSSSSAAPR